MKGTKTKAGVTSKATASATGASKTANQTSSSSGQRNPSTTSKLIHKLTMTRQEHKRGLFEETADMHEKLRLQGRDKGR